MIRAYRVAYDGAPFHGFQRQPGVPTVEDALLDALRALDVLDGDADVPPNYAAAGRTDAGVSALAQTVAFEAPDWLAPRALNADLAPDVRAWARADAPDGFHATHDAVSRTYRYHLHAPEASVGLARATGTYVEGEHDFHNLTPDDEGTVRRVDAVDVQRRGELLAITVRAPGFCRQQVRRLVTVLEDVATGERRREWVEVVLSDAALTGPDGIPPAPAHPLALVDVEYPDLDFAVDGAAADNARDVFAGKRADHLARAAVAGDTVDGIDGE